MSEGSIVDAVSEDDARWLTSSEGIRLLADIVGSLDQGVDGFKLAEQLAGTTQFSPARRAALLHVAHARRQARDRYPHADQMLFTKEGLEQFSDRQVAIWRSESLIQRYVAYFGEIPQRVVDLTAGLGGDASYLGRHGVPLTCIDVDAARAVFLQHNLSVMNIPATVRIADALTFDTGSSDAVFADPARRTQGKRVHAVGSYRPSVPLLLKKHATAGILAIAVAPGVDATDEALPPATSVSYIDVNTQLTEAVVWAGRATSTTVATTQAVALPERVMRSRSGESTLCAIDMQIGGWLVVMRSSAVRARVHDDIARTIDARRVARHRALFHTQTKPPDSPWYRSQKIFAVSSASPKRVREALRNLPEQPVELVLHGVAADVTRLWHSLGSPPRGPQGWRIEFIRRDTDSVALITGTQS